MTIVFVLHEATRTGAPRLGALIARELAKSEPVRLVAMRDGPLAPWLRELLGSENVTICRDGVFDVRTPFETRLERAREWLRGEPCDLVYANSLASSVFAIAARLEGLRCVAHVHEMKRDMLALFAHDAVKLETLRAVDAAILAADEIENDLIEAFATRPPRVMTFGVAVDAQALRVLAEAPPAAPACNARGAPFARSDRLVVGMCGHASARKGADIFLETALRTPHCDFLWVGLWRSEESPDNIAYEDFLRLAPENLYCAGEVENPYPFLRAMDVFFLSSREDPNPLVVGEALTLGVPVLAFSKATAISDRLGRCGLLCHGSPNADDAARMISKLSRETLSAPEFSATCRAYAGEYDLRAKIAKLIGFLAEVREPLASGGRPREDA